jgi:hypothetical protein
MKAAGGRPQNWWILYHHWCCVNQKRDRSVRIMDVRDVSDLKSNREGRFVKKVEKVQGERSIRIMPRRRVGRSIRGLFRPAKWSITLHKGIAFPMGSSGF